MILIYSSGSDYKKGSQFPIMSVPKKFDGAKDADWNDFQWWADSKDFKKWLDANPRSWVADSNNNPDYISSDKLLEYNSNFRSISSPLEFSNRGLSKVSNFGSFLNEDTQVKELTGEALAKGEIKLKYAYNNLIAQGKISEDLPISSLKVGDDKAVFFSLYNSETKETMYEIVNAIRIKPTYSEPNSKIVIVEANDCLPIGTIIEDDTESFWKKLFEGSSQVIKYAVAGVAGALTLKAVGVGGGGLYLNWLVRKRMDRLVPGRVAERAARRAVRTDKIGKVGQILKNAANYGDEWSFSSFVKTPFKVLQATGRGIGEAGEGAAASLMGRAGAGSVIGEIGTGFKAGFSTVADLNPYYAVAQALMAGQKLYNWMSTKQAPRFTDVKDFAHDNFDPKDIPVGKSITVCWTQEKGGAMGALNWIGLGVDTRTTMEIVKIADIEGKSVFILLNINSESMQKELKEHDIIYLVFDDSKKFDTHWYDNDDLTFKMLNVDNIGKIGLVVTFLGVCDWSSLISEYDKSSDQLIVADKKAPTTYDLYFEDSEANVINVSGDIITTDELSKYKDSDYEKLFHIKVAKGKIGPQGNDNKSSFPTTESVSYKDLLEKEFITSFNSFNESVIDYTEYINEDDGPDEDSQGDSEDNNTSEKPTNGESVDTHLTPKQLSGPAKVAAYKVSKKEYANPDLIGKYSTGEFDLFTIPEKYFNAKQDDPIQVQCNTSEVLRKPKAGVFVYREDKGDKGDRDGSDNNKRDDNQAKPSKQGEDDKNKNKGNGDNEMVPGDDGNDIKADPNDVRIVNISNGPHEDQRTEITDNNVKDGINIFERFLTQREKEALGIANWKSITFAQSQYDGRGDTVQVKLRNKYAGFGDRKRTYDVSDGEAFKIASKFVEEVKHRIKPY